MEKHQSETNIKWALFLNLAFTLIELAGGLWTQSLAILSDALHDLGDSTALGMAWFMERLSHKQRTNRYSYGYRRFSLLGALINAVILIAGGFVVLSRAVPRLMNPEPTFAPGMLGFAILGVVVNGIMVYRLRRDSSHNSKMVAWHMLEDVLGWTAVLIVSIILLFSDLYILDPVLSVLITSYVLFRVVKRLYTTLALFLQAVPENIDIDAIEKRFKALDHVSSIHHTHIWSLDGEHHVLTTHLVVDENISRDEVIGLKGRVRALTKKMKISHITVEIEYGESECGSEHSP
ncbi:cation diffusion facilitator family transporter [candidate division KSB1 bacterium]|nr:cation diffusion facilitator family transporter [candidate division KSB1 bacterium]